MKRVFRLANAEFNKIFYRPSIFILTAILIGSLVLSYLLFTPTQNINKLSFEGTSVGAIYQEFTNSTGTKDTKNAIDAYMTTSYNTIDEEYQSIAGEDKLKTMTDNVTSLYVYLQQTVLEEQTSIYGNTTGDSLTSTQKNDLIDLFKELKNRADELLRYLAKIKGETLNFYLKTSEYETIYAEVQDLYENVPTDYSSYKTKSDFSRLSNSLRSNIDLKSSREIVGKLEKLTISEEIYNQLVETYYTNAQTKLEEVYFKQIEDFYVDYYESKEETDMNQINEYIAQYYSFAVMNTTLLENKFMLLRVNDKSDTELKDLVGYNELSKYNITEQNTKYEYMLEKEDFDYNYLNSFNFNMASGSSSNAYDFTVYAMQILSIFIIVFTVFYACSSIAGDQTSGTMKMIAIRPYTRNKLFLGKFLACLMFGVMLLTISLVASLVVGGVMYGLPLTNVLVVFNSTNVMTISPILLLFLYLLSIVINLIFYISLAMFFSLIFKSNTLSVFLSSALYALQIILNGTTNSVWLKYTPWGHFDLFKFFGNSKLGFLSFNILPDSNFIISAVVLGLMIVILNTISHFIFKTRDIS